MLPQIPKRIDNDISKIKVPEGRVLVRSLYIGLIIVAYLYYLGVRENASACAERASRFERKYDSILEHDLIISEQVNDRVNQRLKFQDSINISYDTISKIISKKINR